MNNRFQWADRMHRRRDFSTVFKKGTRFTSTGIAMWAYQDPEAAARGPRLGLAIPSAYGNAVQRNRLKRLLREVFRLNKNDLPRGVDLVFTSRTLIPKANFPTLDSIVKTLWRKAKLLP